MPDVAKRYKVWLTSGHRILVPNIIAENAYQAAERFAAKAKNEWADGEEADVTVEDEDGRVDEFLVHARLKIVFDAACKVDGRAPKTSVKVGDWVGLGVQCGWLRVSRLPGGGWVAMAIPQVSLPVPFEQIPTEVKRLRDHARALRSEADVTSSMIRAVQDCCPHKDTSTHGDYGGGSTTTCKHCDKSW